MSRKESLKAGRPHVYKTPNYEYCLKKYIGQPGYIRIKVRIHTNNFLKILYRSLKPGKTLTLIALDTYKILFILH